MARNFFRIFTENNPVMGYSKTFCIPEAKGLIKQLGGSVTACCWGLADAERFLAKIATGLGLSDEIDQRFFFSHLIVVPLLHHCLWTGCPLLRPVRGERRRSPVE